VAYDLFSDLITGEVNQARATVGALRYGTEVGWKALSYGDVIDAYYTLEWALERAVYGYDGLSPAGRKVQRSLRRAIEWHIKELTTAVSVLRPGLSTIVRDEDSWTQIQQIIELFSGPRDASGRGTPASPDDDEAVRIAQRLAFLKSHH